MYTPVSLKDTGVQQWPPKAKSQVIILSRLFGLRGKEYPMRYGMFK